MSTSHAIDQSAIQPVTLSLRSEAPSLTVEVLPYGCTIHKILVKNGDKSHDIIIGPNEPEEHRLNRGFLNTVVGRYSNRVPVGDIELEKDGIRSTLSLTPTESPEVSLHGGPDGFDRRTFEVIDPVKSPSSYSLFSTVEKQAIGKLSSSAIFKLTSPAGDQGFPGKLNVEILMGLHDSDGAAHSKEEQFIGSLLLVYRAKLILDGSEEKVVTPVNLTQHWGFNLEASMGDGPAPTPDVKEHLLSIRSRRVLELHPNGLATGNLLLTDDSPYEHIAKPVGKHFPPNGYDEYYLFERASTVHALRLPLGMLSELDVVNQLITPEGAPNDPPVILSSERSGIRVLFETNQPGVQFYSGNYLQGNGSRKVLHGGTGEHGIGDGYQAAAGAFLEFHEPLAAWLHPYHIHGDTLLTSDELYNNYTKVNIFVKPT